MTDRCRIVILGLTITSSWGNGHATTYRALVRELARRQHDVLFLERDVRWYAGNRDLPDPPYGKTILYGSLQELRDRFADEVRRADLVLVGSYVPDGIAIGEWVCDHAQGVTAFYDIDTPITLATIDDGTCTYVTPSLMRRYDLYLSFTGGPTLQRLDREYGVPRPRPLYCSFDPADYYPEAREPRWDLGYMGTFSADREAPLDQLLLGAARHSRNRFVVAGPGYTTAQWPSTVEYLPHVAARDHRAFYTAQRYTLNLTRAAMIRAGYSPSVRLFEAAACGVPIISDAWSGLDAFFRLNQEILIVENGAQTLRVLNETTERVRAAISRRARRRVLAEHTGGHRVEQLEQYVDEARRSRSRIAASRPDAVSAPGASS